MNFDENLNQLREASQEKLLTVYADIMDTALQLLRVDIRDPELNQESMHPDSFMLRANQIGLALFNTGFFAVAGKLYRDMLQEVLSYRQQTGEKRHAGALHANLAAALMLQGDVDGTVVELLKAAHGDVGTYGIVKGESFAVTDLLRTYFIDPVRKEALKVIQTVSSTVKTSDMETLGTTLGEREYAFLACANLAFIHEAANRNFATNTANYSFSLLFVVFHHYLRYISDPSLGWPSLRCGLQYARSTKRRPGGRHSTTLGAESGRHRNRRCQLTNDWETLCR